MDNSSEVMWGVIGMEMTLESKDGLSDWCNNPNVCSLAHSLTHSLTHQFLSLLSEGQVEWRRGNSTQSWWGCSVLSSLGWRSYWVHLLQVEPCAFFSFWKKKNQKTSGIRTLSAVLPASQGELCLKNFRVQRSGWIQWRYKMKLLFTRNTVQQNGNTLVLTSQVSWETLKATE